MRLQITESVDMLVTEVRRLSRDADLDMPRDATLQQALMVAECFVGSDEFMSLDEGVRDAWQWVLKKMWRVAKVTAKAKTAAFVLPAIVGPIAAYRAARWGASKAIKKLRGYTGGSGELLRGEVAFMLGDVAFHPVSQNRWRAMLPGRYEMLIRYRPSSLSFSCEVEGRTLGGYWAEDDLGYAVQLALTAIREEP